MQLSKNEFQNFFLIPCPFNGWTWTESLCGCPLFGQFPVFYWIIIDGARSLTYNMQKTSITEDPSHNGHTMRDMVISSRAESENLIQVNGSHKKGLTGIHFSESTLKKNCFSVSALEKSNAIGKRWARDRDFYGNHFCFCCQIKPVSDFSRAKQTPFHLRQ